jgi:hypothetical protein
LDGSQDLLLDVEWFLRVGAKLEFQRKSLIGRRIPNKVNVGKAAVTDQTDHFVLKNPFAGLVHMSPGRHCSTLKKLIVYDAGAHKT